MKPKNGILYSYNNNGKICMALVLTYFYAAYMRTKIRILHWYKLCSHHIANIYLFLSHITFPAILILFVIKISCDIVITIIILCYALICNTNMRDSLLLRYLHTHNLNITQIRTLNTYLMTNFTNCFIIYLILFSIIITVFFLTPNKFFFNTKKLHKHKINFTPNFGCSIFPSKTLALQMHTYVYVNMLYN